MSSETNKKRKIEQTIKEEDNFVTLDLYRFLDLQYHQLLYAQSSSETAKKCIQQGESVAEKSLNDNTCINVGNYLLSNMKEVAQTSKYEIERLLEDKPKFRGRFQCEIAKCEKLIEEIIGKKLVWKTEAIKPHYSL